MSLTVHVGFLIQTKVCGLRSWLASSPGFPAFFGVRRRKPTCKSEAAFKRVGRPGNEARSWLYSTIQVVQTFYRMYTQYVRNNSTMCTVYYYVLYRAHGQPPHIRSEQEGGLIKHCWLIYECTTYKSSIPVQKL